MDGRFGGKAKRTRRVMIEIEYLKDGTYRWSIAEPDTAKGKRRHQKWAQRSHGYNFTIPTWDDLHRLVYAGVVSDGTVPSPSGVIESLIRGMQYDVHCMGLPRALHSTERNRQDHPT